MRKLGTFVVAGVLLLAGCGTAEESKPAAVETTAPAADNTATEAQLASVVARYETDLRNVADQFGECRWKYVDADTDTLIEIEAMVCFTEQNTVTIRAQTLHRDLSALTPPTTMESLVTETLGLAELIGGVDLTVCGETPSVPDLGDKACSEALTGLDVYLSSMTTTLDAWKPYL